MKRFIIYFLYDPAGQVNSTCLFMLRALRGEADRILLVSNGGLQPEAKETLRGMGLDLLERENRGFDVGAYREALLAVGWQALAAYDELVLMNYTIAGPVWPLSEMFAAMEARAELDFWGITRHYAMKSRRFKTEYGFVPEHIQSHFIAVRRRMLGSEAFRRYWQDMQLPQNYEEAVGLHEARFTRKFAEQGFSWDTYVDTEDLRQAFVNPIMACPRELLEHRRCPVFKRRSFFTAYGEELRRTAGSAAGELYDYLAERTDYPVQQLITELLPWQPLAELARNLGWSVILPESAEPDHASILTLPWPAAGEPGALPGELLCLTWREPDGRDAAGNWYRAVCRQKILDALPAVRRLFERDPQLGIVSPALPAYAPLFAERAAAWQAALPELKAALRAAGTTAPLAEETPLPVPFAGVAVVRCAAYPQGLPPQGPASPWLLPLIAQQNGFSCRTVMDARQARACAQAQTVQLYSAQSVPDTAKQLCRILKHRLRRKV